MKAQLNWSGAPLCLLVLAAAELAAQAPTGPSARPGLVAVHATTPAELRTWDTAINQMVRANQLIALDSRPDPNIDGRRHESLGQYHQGIPVYGGSLSRQTANGVTVSIMGTVLEGISTDSGPTLTADQPFLPSSRHRAAGSSGTRRGSWSFPPSPANIVSPTAPR